MGGGYGEYFLGGGIEGMVFGLDPEVGWRLFVQLVSNLTYWVQSWILFWPQAVSTFLSEVKAILKRT